MSIRWIRSVVIDDEKTMIEIQLGDRKIGDKCYVRVGNEVENYFDNMTDSRDDIVEQGKDLLKKKIGDKRIMYADGRQYDWQ